MNRAVVDQGRIFEDSEGDRWFARNASALGDCRSDIVTRTALEASVRAGARSICEAGCANGFRLAALAMQLPGARLAGFDVSHHAIADGRRRWPELELAVGPLDAPPVTGPFDLAIVSFVLHWVDRNRLDSSIAAVNSLIIPGGRLVIADFLPDTPCVRLYHHRQDVALFTYKQNYARPFVEHGYREIERVIFHHSGADLPASEIGEQDRSAVILLEKPA